MRLHFILIGSLSLCFDLVASAGARPADCCAPHWEAAPSAGLQPVVILDLLEADLDGDGQTTLYAAGSFGDGTTVAARENGQWVGVRGSPTGGHAHTLAMFDDGGGPALYVGGSFSNAGGKEAHNIAKWDGRDWSALAGGVSGQAANQGVFALAVFDDGSSPALYAGGIFDTAGGAPAQTIARWNGQTWTEVGGGLAVKTWNGYPIVMDMLVFPHHGRDALLVGGNFSHAGSVPTQALVAWDGAAWTHLNVDPVYGVQTMVVWCNPLNVNLLAIEGVAQGSLGGVGVWDGDSFSLLGQLPFQTDRQLAAFDDGIDATPGLYITRRGPEGQGLLRWSGNGWEQQPGALSGGSAPYAPHIHALVPARNRLQPDGQSVLLVAGDFESINSQPSVDLALWVAAPTVPVQGDANDDCCVNIDDLTAVILAWGRCGVPPCPTDFDSDGDTDVDDLTTVIINWSP
jgi:hypothetical protein